MDVSCLLKKELRCQLLLIISRESIGIQTSLIIKSIKNIHISAMCGPPSDLFFPIIHFNDKGQSR